MNKEICNGTWVTMTTAFTDDNKIDYAGIEEILHWYKKNKIDGIFAVCQSSEMFFLTLEERIRLAEFVLKKVGGTIPVVISGHVSDSIQDQITELTEMSKLGAQAVVLVSNRLAGETESDEVWKANALRILEAVPDTDFGIYECPYPYKRVLSPELLAWCAGTGRFTFLKDTCCDAQMIKAKLDAVKGTQLKIFNANSATLLETMKYGCSGFCGVMLNFHPDIYQWLTHHWQEDLQKSEKLQHFATVASLIELQLYPTNSKYHMQLDGVHIKYNTRSKDISAFNKLKKIEVEHLYQLWKDLDID